MNSRQVWLMTGVFENHSTECTAAHLSSHTPLSLTVQLQDECFCFFQHSSCQHSFAKIFDQVQISTF